LGLIPIGYINMAEKKLGNMTDAEKDGEVIFKLGDEVMYNGEKCTVIGVEDAGGSFYSSESMASDNASRAGHSQRLRLRETKWKNEYYPISGANCTKI